MSDIIEDFYNYLKKRNNELQEQIDSNKELMEFIEEGGYIEWKQQ